GTSPGSCHVGAVDPSGRIFAATAGDGVRLWDINRGTELVHLPAGPTTGVAFALDGDLLTCGPSGVFYWPIRMTNGGRPILRVGPPRQVTDWPCEQIDADKNGQVFAIASRTHGVAVFSPNQSDPRPISLAREDIEFL